MVLDFTYVGKDKQKLILDIETTGLNPMIDRIICVSTLNTIDLAMTTIILDDERVLLEKFWSLVYDQDLLISFNGDVFDIPFLLKRSIINKVKCKRFNSLDLRKIANGYSISNDKYVKGSLSDWARILNIERKTEDGSQMIIYFHRKEFEKIKNHCEEDILITKSLYDRLKECDLL